MHSIWVEPGFADSIWCQQILQGLTGELKKRREAFLLGQESEGDQFIIGSTAQWLGDQVTRCNRRGQVPVLLCDRKISGGRYHSVCSDIAGSMGLLTQAMSRRWGNRLALYGVNPHSVGDRSRRDAFLLECQGPCLENNGSLAQCFQSLVPLLDQLDGIICVNGFAAVSLYRSLQAIGKRLPIISCAQTLLCRSYGAAIPAVDENFLAFGKAALGLADLARKDPRLWELTATVRWSIDGLPQEALPRVVAPSGQNRFYEDPELQQMLKVENLLSRCDDTDKQLLPMLLKGQSYADMACACFLTEGAVKYRIKNMRTHCACPDRESLERLLQTYLPTDT